MRTTRWTLDPATGLCLSKTNADNSTVSYSYTPDGLPARTTWPDGRWNELAYDEARNVVGMIRSDATPGISLSCDAYGETTNVVDTVGNAWLYVYGENSALLCETNILAGGRLSSAAAYTPNGGLASDGDWLYAYDAEDRLASVTSASLTNGALRVESAYDWRDRRISKTVSRYDSTEEEWNIVERRVFTYDDWNLVHETIMQIDGTVPTTAEIQYFWGTDLSETLQGAGGVGGLLAVSMSGSVLLPLLRQHRQRDEVRR